MNNIFSADNPLEQLTTIDPQLLELLLYDQTTEDNIIWATADYAAFAPLDPIQPDDARIIEPRFMKTQERRTKRTKARAEVFTPSHICKLQNDLVDEPWRERIEHEPLEYIDARRLEIACGEAPYLVSRYDVVDGRPIPLDQRIGLLDRKLHLVNRLVDNPSDWFNLTRRAFQSIYGYEFQGDNLLIARCNLILSADEYFQAKFHEPVPRGFLEELTDIITWNLWQFDAIANTIPFHADSDNLFEHNLAPICLIRDWLNRTLVKFPSMEPDGSFDAGGLGR